MSLGRKHYEQRCGVNGPVIPLPLGKGAGPTTTAQLVNDLSRLFLGRRVVRLPLQLSELANDTAGDLGRERQRHERRKKRVAAKQRHEPRRTRGNDDSLRVIRIKDPQGGEIFETAFGCHLQPGIIGNNDGNPLVPRCKALERDSLAWRGSEIEQEPRRLAVHPRFSSK